MKGLTNARVPSTCYWKLEESSIGATETNTYFSPLS